MDVLMLIIVVILCISYIDAASFPVMYCTNEEASAIECVEEANGAAAETQKWFDAYMSLHASSNRERRHLMDCSRFCRRTPAYFTIHYPCDCRTDRKLTSIDVPDGRSLEYTYAPEIEGPIQIFKAFVSTLPDSFCKDIMLNSQCLIGFVERYDNVVPEIPQDTEENIPEDYYLNESYDPLTKKYEIYDPETNELVEPINNNMNNEDENPDENPNNQPYEMYDPATQTYRLYDPVAGLYLDDENDGSSVPNTGGSSSSSNSNNENNGYSFHDTVYDPVTGEYVKVDTETGGYIDDVKEYEEVYDPNTGEYHKVDPTTGKFVDEP